MATAPPVPQIVTRGDMAGNVISFARHLRAANLTPATQRTYLDSLDRLAHLLEASGMPTDVAALRREQTFAGESHVDMKDAETRTCERG